MIRGLSFNVSAVGIFAISLYLVTSGAPSADAQRAICDVISAMHPTIQSAVDDPNCDLISVGEGSFSEHVNIGRSVMISGQGAERTTIEGHGTLPIISVQQGITVTLWGLAIQNGLRGGIAVYGSSVTIEDSLIADNRSPEGGGIMMRPVFIDNRLFDTRLTVLNSVISGNVASSGGGISNKGGTLVVISSMISGNHAHYGGGIQNSDFDFAPRCPTVPGTAQVEMSTISNNSAEGSGGGIINTGATLRLEESTLHNNTTSGSGGGLFNYGGTAAIHKSTLSRNRAADGAGIYTDYDFSVAPYSCYQRTETEVVISTLSENEADANGGGIYNGGGGVRIISSTLARNGAEWGGGGIYSIWPAEEKCEFGDCSPHSIMLRNAIIADSLRGGECSTGDAAVVTNGGFNLVENGSCISGSTSITGDPGLDDLAQNGGPTATHALLPHSIVIDAGNCAGSDQRGVHRPLDGDGDTRAVCDIGAFEYVNYTNFLNLPLAFK